MSSSPGALEPASAPPLQSPTPADLHHLVFGRVGFPGGLGVEYAVDLQRVVQLGISLSSWYFRSELGIDLRLAIARKNLVRFHVTPGFRVQNSPLLYALGFAANLELGLEYVKSSGFAFGAGVGASVLLIPPGVPAEGHGFQGVVPVAHVRLGRAWARAQ